MRSPTAAVSLQSAGAELLVLCTNTMHKVADEVAAAIDIPLLHIGDTTAAAVKDAGVRRVGLLGTGFTMAQPFYADRLGVAAWTSSSPTRTTGPRCTGSSTTSCASA